MTVIKQYNSGTSAWETIVVGAQGPQGTTGSKGTLFQSSTAPSSPAAGDAWFNTDTGETFTYYDSYWVAWGNGAQGAAGANPSPEDDQLVLSYQVFS